MVWRSGQTCSGNLRAEAGGSGRSQCGVIFQGDYFLHLQDTCAAQGDRHRPGSAENQAYRPQAWLRPRCQERPYNLLAGSVEWSRIGHCRGCALQPGRQLRPSEASRSKARLRQHPAGARGCCRYHATITPRLRRPIVRGTFDRTVNRSFSQYFPPTVAWRHSAALLAVTS
jgi:hypothetical protein